jgi:hypothetical protein
MSNVVTHPVREENLPAGLASRHSGSYQLRLEKPGGERRPKGGAFTELPRARIRRYSIQGISTLQGQARTRIRQIQPQARVGIRSFLDGPQLYAR